MVGVLWPCRNRIAVALISAFTKAQEQMTKRATGTINTTRFNAILETVAGLLGKWTPLDGYLRVRCSYISIIGTDKS